MCFEGEEGHLIEEVVETVWKIRNFSATLILRDITFSIFPEVWKKQKISLHIEKFFVKSISRVNYM